MLLVIASWCIKVYFYTLGFSHLDVYSNSVEWDTAQTIFIAAVMAILDLVVAVHIKEDGPDLGSKKGILTFTAQILVVQWLVMIVYYIVYYSIKNWMELPDEIEEEKKK